MQRLVVKNVIRSSSGWVARTRCPYSCIRPSYHFQDSSSSICHQRHCFPNQRISFSTSAPVVEIDDDLSGLSLRESEQLALKHARQAQPNKAQRILQHLQETSQASEEGIAVIRSSVVDAWLEYQKQQLKLLQQDLTKRHLLEGTTTTTSGIIKERVETIYQAAIAASELVEGGLPPVGDDKKKGSTHHILAVLRTWANASVAVHLAGFKSNISRTWSGIPQRAQYILDTHYGATTTTPPPTEAINQVLKAWAYSNEYLRGTMAEQIFQKYFQTDIGGKKQPPYADGESHRCMMYAWSWSKESRGAFTATGHYMRMLRLMENGETDMELTLEDYRILFQSWTTAE